MILKMFRARKVYDYLDFEFNFTPNVNILIGSNGSGKTTIIRLIKGLVIPSFDELFSIEFLEASLTIDTNGKESTIQATSKGDAITISVSNISQDITFSRADFEKWSVTQREPQARLTPFDEILDKVFPKNAVVAFLKSIENPVILGIERRLSDFETIEEESRRYYDMHHRMRQRRYSGALGVSLGETMFIIQNIYREIRQLQDDQNKKLRDKIILSSFKYTSGNIFDQILEQKKPVWEENSDVFKRQAEIESMLISLGFPGETIKADIKEFFTKLQELYQNMERQGSKGISIEYFINKAQIDRISDLLKVIDDFKSLNDKIMNPITLILESINKYFEDSRKKIGIDTVGQLYVTRFDHKKNTIEALSSGERQLVIMFCHLMFGVRKRKGSLAFIIDEPELSLHLKWQSLFINSLVEISPNSQFILATHSPEIVGDYKECCIDLDGAN